MAISCNIILTILPLFLLSIPGYFPQELETSDYYKSPNLAKEPDRLGIDQALLQINVTQSDSMGTFTVTGVTDECYKCRKPVIAVLHKHLTTAYIIIDFTYSTFSLNVKQDGTSGINCSYPNFKFGEKGKYLLTIHKPVDGFSYTCAKKITVNTNPEFSELALLVAGCALIGVLFLWFCYSSLCRRRCVATDLCFQNHERLINTDLGTPDHLSHQHNSDQSNTTPPQRERRLKSLDTFRGISLTIMIFVNYGGGKYWFFKHSRWNGLTVADLVFPWFVFIMGVSITLSFRVLQRRGASKLSTFKKIIRRSIILFVLGLILNNGYNLENFRIPGVLQRFSITYFVVATMQFLAVRTDKFILQYQWLNEFVDTIELSIQWLLMIVLVIIYLVVTFVVKFPGCPGGYLGAGGLSAEPHQENCTGGIAGYIDRTFFTEKHIYQHPTCMEVYQTKIPYDPEGILGSLTSILLAFLGVQAGKILFCYSTNKERYLRWILWASVLGILAIGLSGGTLNEGVIPINKNLWSLSFVLANASMAFFLLFLCYFLIDDHAWWDGGPFCYPGMNSILVYCGSEIMDNYFPFHWKMHNGGSHFEALPMNILGTSLWICISYYLFTKKFFLKI